MLRFWARRTRLHPRAQSLKENTDDYAPRAQKFSGLPIYNEAHTGGRRDSPARLSLYATRSARTK
jgi:hypothetical protein